MNPIQSIFWIALAIVFLLILITGVRFIPNNHIGIVEKRFGRTSVKGNFIALHGKAGYQPDVLRGGPQYQVTQQVMNRFAEAVQQSRVDVVPRVVVGGGNSDGGGSGSSIMEGLLTLLLSDKLGLETNRTAAREPTEEVERMKQEIRQSLATKHDSDGGEMPKA